MPEHNAIPDTHMLQVIRYDSLVHEGEDVVRVGGWSQDGQWSRTIVMGEEAGRVAARLRNEVGPSEGMAGRHVVLCEGHWRVSDTSRNGAPYRDRVFVSAKLDVIVGPAAELMIAKMDAAKALAKADEIRRAAMAVDDPSIRFERLLEAYRAIEANVSTLTRQPAPSTGPDVDVNEVVLVNDRFVPELEARRRFEAMDAARGVSTGRTPDSTIPEAASVEDAVAKEPVAHEGSAGTAPVDDGGHGAPAADHVAVEAVGIRGEAEVAVRETAAAEVVHAEVVVTEVVVTEVVVTEVAAAEGATDVKAAAEDARGDAKASEPVVPTITEAPTVEAAKADPDAVDREVKTEPAPAVEGRAEPAQATERKAEPVQPSRVAPARPILPGRPPIPGRPVPPGRGRPVHVEAEEPSSPKM